MKTNVKVGGFNYNLVNSDMKLIVNNKKLIIGIGFNHTRSGTSDGLTTVGFAANTTKDSPHSWAVPVNLWRMLWKPKILLSVKKGHRCRNRRKYSRGHRI
ncbi:Stem cell self-renewal protein Piwi domain-containing protein [Strongyloides ratti]|uniref:Stem cell self-renewal protein Piwi domain-containing protein n=1 Tax=Strongyloides ratti TaxID=34506 RepID=A0A090L7N8_STRRB|nr:Stem cell self-renewal protein Piwi domain-containing protein [Strongyloides ratti]CEF65811.1 Stem cell self-renewal protein Piwi domain-containing protein [Strongyloides ratti]